MASFQAQIEELRSRFLSDLKGAFHTKDIEEMRFRYLGKKGPVQALMVHLKDCSSEEKPRFGKMINDLKEELSTHLEEHLICVREKELEERLAGEWIDVTLPGRFLPHGRMHPITRMLDWVSEILSGMGFSVRLGPDVDTDYYNFEGLNFAADHPARDMQDTFYLDEGFLLRTHTSNVQVHIMEKFTPPFRVIAPGKCFRNEDVSARSHVFFHQIEGFAVDKRSSFADLMATMEELLQKIFGSGVKMRCRPSYFPFVEPGMEIDIGCITCGGSGCRLCKHTGWLEVLGAGMIHPNVLRKGNIDPEEYQGYAWGMGIERLAMLLFNVRDIRYFTQNDIRFLEQLS